jgi:hypothetical protein
MSLFDFQQAYVSLPICPCESTHLPCMVKKTKINKFFFFISFFCCFFVFVVFLDIFSSFSRVALSVACSNFELFKRFGGGGRW